MAKDTNRGQQKEHLVRDADGNEFMMTQADWRNRDKSAGLERVGETDADENLVEEPTVEEGESDEPVG